MEWRRQVLAGPAEMARSVPEEDKLNRALVAGLMLDALLEVPGLPEDPQARQRLLKARVQDTLVSHLAGRVTLDRFRRLALRLNHWFSLYYPLISPPGPARVEASASSGERFPQPGTGLPRSPALQAQALEDWLRRHPDLLPRRRHSKLSGAGLVEFLRRTQGGWFRLKDFQGYFHIDRKTAWEYLQKFRQAGLLTRNRGRSTAGRFSLAPAFLRVKAPALRCQVESALAGVGENLAAQVGDWLIASGGEAFWEEDWQGRLDKGKYQEVLNRLKAAALLEVVYQAGRSALVRLPEQWVG